jgi:NaMN:DMB phosphoribosyltransferase
MHDGSTGPFLCQMHHILSVTKQNGKKISSSIQDCSSKMKANKTQQATATIKLDGLHHEHQLQYF